MAITKEAAYAMGAKGGPTVEAERELFEEWMRGHCWALSATWRGTQYKSDSEDGGDLDPRAMQTRRLWAAWRDRAALAQADSQSFLEAHPHNPDAKCKCEHWQSCADCHPTAHTPKEPTP